MSKLILRNQNGFELGVLPFGARIVSLQVPNKHGQLNNIIQGYETKEEYIEHELSLGAICGRYANRIANARFSIGNESYILNTNDGKHCLHGGNNGFWAQTWECIEHTEKSITFSLVSKHLDGGFPGDVRVKVKYTLSNNAVMIDFSATTNQDTVLNLTAHPYFNLSGDLSSSILNHQLLINADKLVPINEEGIPTGDLLTVENTCFNFLEFAPIKQLFDNNHSQTKIANGIDHSYAFNVPNRLQHQASLFFAETGRLMKIYSTYPALQVYTANHLHTPEYGNHSSVCLEPQFFPDSPNQNRFPSTLLRAGELYLHSIKYEFMTQ